MGWIHPARGEPLKAIDELAGLYDASGRRKEARDAYTRLLDLWKDADPELQPRVLHARERIVALSR
jgi:hypothetical protein